MSNCLELDQNRRFVSPEMIAKVISRWKKNTASKERVKFKLKVAAKSCNFRQLVHVDKAF